MLNGDGNANGKKIQQVSLTTKHFFVHFFAVVLQEFNVKLPSDLHVLRRKCRMRSCCPGGLQHFSFSHCRYKIFMFFLQRNLSLSFFSLQLQLFHCYSGQCSGTKCDISHRLTYRGRTYGRSRDYQIFRIYRPILLL